MAEIQRRIPRPGSQAAFVENARRRQGAKAAFIGNKARSAGPTPLFPPETLFQTVAVLVSSNVMETWVDGDDLMILFIRNRTYRFRGDARYFVPLTLAPSPGRFVHRYLKA